MRMEALLRRFVMRLWVPPVEEVKRKGLSIEDKVVDREECGGVGLNRVWICRIEARGA
ncbi:uncharacterized protein G2W53_042625 [Senna tora]|uniref:Uncharacterized protein n=1 Tax=Senna tora TaxID=362788 RepID=A0A834SH74_9FABA|nr:uncharacterized protein G2W53_042625 [Senna tora]